MYVCFLFNIKVQSLQQNLKHIAEMFCLNLQAIWHRIKLLTSWNSRWRCLTREISPKRCPGPWHP